MRGDPPTNPMPPATDGFIKDGNFTYSGTSGVYAARLLRGAVRSVGAAGSFRSLRPGYKQSALSISITANDRLVTDMVTLSATRDGWNMKMRRAGDAPVILAQGGFSPRLELGRKYQFELDATADSLTAQVPGAEITKKVSTAGALGNYVTFQEHAVRTPASDVFDFDTSWAVEDGQPLTTVAEAE